MLPDILQSGLKLVVCGTAVGEKSAAAGAYYAGPGNTLWATLHDVGLTPRRLSPAEFRILPTFGIGLTDIVKCRAGNDDALSDGDFDVAGFEKKMLQFAPRALAFNGKRAAAVFFGCGTGSLKYGLAAERIGDSAIFVLPSTSGAARGFWSIEPWRELAAVACGDT
jgi:TDG/mug DNA glycosylase family protein